MIYPSLLFGGGWHKEDVSTNASGHAEVCLDAYVWLLQPDKDFNLATLSWRESIPRDDSFVTRYFSNPPELVWNRSKNTQ